MTTIQTKSDIIAALQQSYEQVISTATQLPDTQFFTGTDTEWSPADYLKHLILSVKPFARALQLTPEQLESMFGTSADGSMTYTELVEAYDAKIQAGLRAESSPSFTPVSYDLPEDVQNIQGYLIEAWEITNKSLIAVLDNWSELDMDTYVLPHPALSNITLREMCFFTIHHNQVHNKDMQSK